MVTINQFEAEIHRKYEKQATTTATTIILKTINQK
jgi:hypothetical protein